MEQEGKPNLSYTQSCGWGRVEQAGVAFDLRQSDLNLSPDHRWRSGPGDAPF